MPNALPAAARAALDDETQALLDEFARASGPAISAMSVAESRSVLDQLFRALAPPSLDVGSLREDHLPGPGGPIRFRLYRPRGAPDTCPVLLFLHGGGWSLGTLECYDAVVRWLCAKGEVTILTLEYRLAPEARFPAALEDAAAALTFIRRHGPALGVDPRRLVIGGDSAGATLAASLCLPSEATKTPRPTRLLLLYPIVTLADAAAYASRAAFGGGAYFLTRDGIEEAATRYLPPAHPRTDPRVSPVLAPDVSGVGKALIITAGYDPLRDEGEHYAERLRHVGTDVDYHCFATTIHGFLSFSGRLSIGRQGLDAAAGWLREHARR